jgi:hypothetical protein
MRFQFHCKGPESNHGDVGLVAVLLEAHPVQDLCPQEWILWPIG